MEQFSTQNFGLSKNCQKIAYSCRKIFIQNERFKAKKLILGKFRGKIKILSTHNPFRRKYATVG